MCFSVPKLPPAAKPAVKFSLLKTTLITNYESQNKIAIIMQITMS